MSQASVFRSNTRTVHEGRKKYNRCIKQRVIHRGFAAKSQNHRINQFMLTHTHTQNTHTHTHAHAQAHTDKNAHVHTIAAVDINTYTHTHTDTQSWDLVSSGLKCPFGGWQRVTHGGDWRSSVVSPGKRQRFKDRCTCTPTHTHGEQNPARLCSNSNLLLLLLLSLYDVFLPPIHSLKTLNWKWLCTGVDDSLPHTEDSGTHGCPSRRPLPLPLRCLERWQGGR